MELVFETFHDKIQTLHGAYELRPTTTLIRSLGTKLVVDDHNIYSVKSERHLFEFTYPITEVAVRIERNVYIPNKTQDFIQMQKCIMSCEQVEKAIIFTEKMILIYDEKQDDIEIIMKFTTPYLLSIGPKYYFTVFYENCSFIYSYNNCELSYVVQNSKVTEMTRDLFVAYDENVISIRHISDLTKNIYECHAKNLYPKSKYFKTSKDKKIISGVLIMYITPTEILKPPDQQIFDKLIVYIDTKSVSHVDSNNLCCICYSELTSKIVLDPCGHSRYCISCASKLTHCALCRIQVTKIIRVFD